MSALRFEPERISGSDDLVADLLAGQATAVDLFPAGRFARDGVPTGTGRRLVSDLGLSAFHCPAPGARERLAAALAGDGLVVTTGQQPQLFGGPLYVLYKALTAVRVAATVERQTGVPCVAVFWVAGDDHDWGEVASVSFLDRAERWLQMDLQPPDGRSGRSVGPSRLPAQTGPVTREFVDSLETHRPGEVWRELLLQAYTPGVTFTDAFVRVVSAWMEGIDIAFLDSAHADVRQAASPLVRTVLEEREGVDRALRRGTEAVVEGGYRVQLTQVKEAIPLFRDGPSGRFRLKGTSGRIQWDEEGATADVSEVVTEAEAEPGRYSPAAALRPVLESWLLPVTATVLGPGEIAYWSQLSPLFELLDVPMPAVVPRDSWRVVEPRTERLLRKAEVSADDLVDGGAAAAARLIERRRPRRVEEALADLEAHLAEDFGYLHEAVASELPGLKSAVGKSRSHAFSALAGLRKSLDRMTRDREEAALGQLRRAATHLYPDGTAQERAVAVWVYLARHGERFLEAARIAALGTPGEAPESLSDGVAGGSAAE